MESQNKSNIPLLIIGVFVSFAIFIGYMVYQAFQTDVNLVRDDYYQESTKHNEHVAEIRRSNAADIKLFYKRKDNKVVFKVPVSFNEADVNGEIHFYRPSDGKLDFKIPIKMNKHKQELSTDAIESGKWNLKVSFSYKGEQYFKECTFTK